MRPLLHALLIGAALASTATAADFDGIRITLLGTGTRQAEGAGPGPSTLIEARDEVLLFDCGPGTRGQLEQAGVAPADITALFLTSLDPEHTAGCGELWRTRRNAGRPPVWGPQGVQALVADWDASQAAAPALSGAPVYAITDNLVYQTEHVTVTAVVVDYPLMPEAYGYRIDSHERAVALSGNTRYSENLARYTSGVHVLVHEVAAFAEPGPVSVPARDLAASHSAPEDAARTFGLARPGLAVYSDIILAGVSEQELMRRTRRGYRGAIEIGRDLMIIEVQNEVQVRNTPSVPRY